MKGKKGGAGITILVIIGILILLFVIGFIGQAVNLWNLKFWGPKYEDAKRDIWEQTNSRINGAIQQIAESRLEYLRTEDPIEKEAICSTLRSMYPDITTDEIDDYTIRQFFSNCKYGVN